jgi:hypothetical protein
MYCKRILNIISFIAFCSSYSVYAQEALIIKRINEEIDIDGVSDEAAWQNIKPLPLVVHQPVFGAEPTERTEILFAYDNKYLYAAGRFFDSEPEKILMTSKKRDVMWPANDWFGIILDTYNDEENGLGFFTTPVGLRTDAAIFNDGTGLEPVNKSWNTFWDVASCVTDSGWITEVRIPFSSLRFQETGNIVKMGLITWRWIPHKNEIQIFPAIAPDYGDWSSWKPSKANDIIFEGLKPQKPLYITPYILGGLGQENLLNDDETEYIRKDKPAYEAGLDVKYGLTNNLTLDVSLNTDFAQVEADDEQVNLTRFSLFFPEKRQFFQERSSIFEFNMGGDNTLFYSRRIGLHEDEPIRIYGGARIIGRMGPWDIGGMNMHTAESDSLPSENIGVARFRRQIINKNTYLGGIITTRTGLNGDYNCTYGIDGIIRMFGDDYLKLVWAQSIDEKFDFSQFMRPSGIYINWERRKDVGLGYDFRFDRSGEDFNPGIGFQLREDYSHYYSKIIYGWLGNENSSVFKQGSFFEGEAYSSLEDNKIESVILIAGYKILFKSNLYGEIGFNMQYENLSDTFEIDDDEVVIHPGEYKFYSINAGILTPMSKPLSVDISVNYGSFYDGWKFTQNISPVLNISSSWEVGGTYEFNNVVFSNRNQHFLSHILRLKGLYMFNTKFSVSSFMQLNSAADEILINLRLRYNPREGNDFYLVYNEDFNTYLEREIPALPRTISRTILLKYTYTFRL